jgi:hypothetical protein
MSIGVSEVSIIRAMSDDRGSKDLRNVGKLVTVYTPRQHRSQPYSYFAVRPSNPKQFSVVYSTVFFFAIINPRIVLLVTPVHSFANPF